MKRFVKYALAISAATFLFLKQGVVANAEGIIPISEMLTQTFVSNDVPLKRNTECWSVLGLMFTLVNVLLSLTTICRTRKKYCILQKREDETFEQFEARKEENLKATANNERDNSFIRLFCLITAIFAIIYFMVSEDITLPAAILNKNCYVTGGLLITQILMAFSVIRYDC